ncbi:hypothetical protein GCM10010377_70600 [Streptomyces viridiviolaceus]|nr:hypothetical protein GCM10010377_70600 [Streptomyces viridiviolaceus]
MDPPVGDLARRQAIRVSRRTVPVRHAVLSRLCPTHQPCMWSSGRTCQVLHVLGTGGIDVFLRVYVGEDDCTPARAW